VQRECYLRGCTESDAVQALVRILAKRADLLLVSSRKQQSTTCANQSSGRHAMDRVLDAIQSNVKVGDYIKFSRPNGAGLGEIIHDHPDKVHVRLFYEMDTVTMHRFFLSLITDVAFSVASQNAVLEVYQSSDECYVNRCDITDVAFILPVNKLEAGMFFLSRAEDTFFIRYLMHNGSMRPCNSTKCFACHLVEPLGIRLFSMLNTLSQMLFQRRLFTCPYFRWRLLGILLIRFQRVMVV